MFYDEEATPTVDGGTPAPEGVEQTAPEHHPV